MSEFKKIAVIGSGVMGAGIAVAIANANVEVLLFDVVPDGASDRNILAKTGIDKCANMLMHPDNIKLITPCNLEDHLNELTSVDWIIEAIIEKVEIKQELYRKISPYLWEDCIISSNTSTILLSKLLENMDAKFRKKFVITHFFNPPRHMRLLELITCADTDLSVIKKLEKFCDIELGKGVIKCNDRPGFIANRIGCFYLELGLKEALALDINPTIADLLMSSFVGIPKTGIFGLMDLIGIDVMKLISGSLAGALEPSDYFNQIYKKPEIIDKMIEKKLLGRKNKSGFYRINNIDGKKIRQVLNLRSCEYEDEIPSSLVSLSAKTLNDLIKIDDVGAEFSRRILWQLLYYAASLVPEISADIVDVDLAMKLGFNWKYGPFELIDKIGIEFVIDNIKKNNLPVPLLLQKNQKFYPTHKKSDYLILEDVHSGRALFSNDAVSLWDLGDEVACLELKTKMNILNLEAFKGIEASLEIASAKFKSMVIIGGDNFSCGADLKYIKSLIEKNDFASIEQFIAKGQETMMAVKYAKIPIIAALSGFALGGGCELALHAHKIRAYAESYVGLVEPVVGLIPAFGGCKESLYNYRDSKHASVLFENIMKGEVSKSAIIVRDMFLLGDKISITMNKDRLLSDAKALARDAARDFTVQTRVDFDAVNCEIDLSAYAGHDLMVAEYLKEIFNHKIKEDELLSMEKQAFIELCKKPETIIKIANKL